MHTKLTEVIDTERTIAPLHDRDLSAVALVHTRALKDNALTRLGTEAVRRYYEWQLCGPHEHDCIGVFQRDRLVGFAVGGITSGVLAGFVKKNKWFLVGQTIMTPGLVFSERGRKAIVSAFEVLRRSRTAPPGPSREEMDQPRSFGILAIAIDPIFQGKGVGRQLMEHLEQIAREQHFPRMHLRVNVRNVCAIRFYEKLPGSGEAPIPSGTASWKNISRDARCFQVGSLVDARKRSRSGWQCLLPRIPERREQRTVRMRVLLAHNYYRSGWPSGEGAVFRHERALLEAHGIDVVPFERSNDDIDDTSLGASIAMALDATWSRRTARDLEDVLRKTAPDVAHFHNTFPLISPSAYATCRRYGVPVVQTLHNYRLICPSGVLYRDGAPCELCVGSSLTPAIRHRCYHGSRAASAAVAGMLTVNRLAGSYSRNVDRYIALTRFAARLFARGGLPEEKLCVKPNSCADPGRTLPAPERDAYAIFAGRLGAEKGVAMLIDAWRGLPGIPLLVVGDGPMRDLVRDACQSGAINGRFLGFRSPAETHELISRARFQVVPSECYEGFPMVIAEACARGVAVLAARIGGLAEIVVEGETGLSYEPGDLGQFRAQAVRLSDLELADRLGRGARAAYERTYSDEQNLAALMRIYDGIKESAVIGHTREASRA